MSVTSKLSLAFIENFSKRQTWERVRQMSLILTNYPATAQHGHNVATPQRVLQIHEATISLTKAPETLGFILHPVIIQSRPRPDPNTILEGMNPYVIHMNPLGYDAIVKNFLWRIEIWNSSYYARNDATPPSRMLHSSNESGSDTTQAKANASPGSCPRFHLKPF